MKPVKNLVFALLLVSAIAVPTLGGDIETPGYVPPPPPRMSTTTDDTTSETATDTEQTQQTLTETSDYLLLEALAALLTMY